jgi:hypothetical protein
MLHVDSDRVPGAEVLQPLRVGDGPVNVDQQDQADHPGKQDMQSWKKNRV